MLLSEYQKQFEINPESINLSVWIMAQELGIKDLKEFQNYLFSRKEN